MTKQSPYVLTMGIAIGLLVGISVPRPQQVAKADATQASQAVDAAFRDGMFQAKLDIQNGRKPRLAAGRWNSDTDRALFIAGYKQAYREPVAGLVGKLAKPNAAELAGYSDGTLDGAAHHAASQSFQADKTNNYRNGGPNYAELRADSANSLWEYRHAYLNGYQQAYYSQEKATEWSYYSQEKRKELKTVSERAGGSVEQQ